MGIVVYSLQWVMQDFVHQPYHYNNNGEDDEGIFDCEDTAPP